MAADAEPYAYANAYLNTHRYGVAVHIGNVADIMTLTGQSKEEVYRMLAQPAFWQGLWAASVPGGASFRDLTRGRDGSFQGEFILTPGADHVRVRHQGVGISPGGVINSFLAKTMDRHALRGTVQHNLIVRADGRIFLCWEGAGGGGPTGGSVNALVALNSQLGMWPNVARNARDLLKDRDAVADLDSMARTGEERYFNSVRQRGLQRERLNSVLAGQFSRLGRPFRWSNERYCPTKE
jgi:hypothetical protein